MAREIVAGSGLIAALIPIMMWIPEKAATGYCCAVTLVAYFSETVPECRRCRAHCPTEGACEVARIVKPDADSYLSYAEVAGLEQGPRSLHALVENILARCNPEALLERAKKVKRT